MSVEICILRAYAFASKCQYLEAERVLKTCPESLNTTSGLDLYARLLYATGQKDEARTVWERILAQFPEFEPAARALEAFDHPEKYWMSYDDERWWMRFGKTGILCASALLCVVMFMIGWLVYTPSVDVENNSVQCEPSEPPPSIIAEQTLEISKINGKVLSELRNGILTNVTDKTVLVISGGQGKYATDRMRNLSSIAACVKNSTGISFQKMFLQVGDEPSENVRIVVMENFLKKGKIGDVNSNP